MENMKKYEYKVIPTEGLMYENSFKYNVQVWQRSYYDGEFQMIYAGNGRFCRTLDEVKDFIKKWEER